MSAELEECRLLLADLLDGKLNSLQKQRLDQLVSQSKECAELMSDAWQMQAAATRWQDEQVPAWQRLKAFFPDANWLPNIQWVSIFASVLVLVLVLTNANVDTSRGFSISFGEQGMTEAEVVALINDLEKQQQTQLDTTIATLNSQQVATNQLLLRTVMKMNREERKEDLSTLLSVWDATQDQRAQQTDESLSVLFASQIEDRRNLDQINRLLRQASLEGNNL